jgi:hypothetical protein
MKPEGREAINLSSWLRIFFCNLFVIIKLYTINGTYCQEANCGKWGRHCLDANFNSSGNADDPRSSFILRGHGQE